MPSATELAGTGASDTGIGAAAWTSPGNITAEDSSSASCTASGSDITHGLQATNFGFSIPSGATIDGVVATFRRRYVFGTPVDYSVRLIKGGVYTGTDKALGAFWPPAFSKDSFGGSTDLWGTTLSDTDVNASNFGVMIQAQDDTGFSSTFEVDSVEMTIHYTEGGGSGQKSTTRSNLLASVVFGALIQ